MDGIINIYKESGYTSHDVVAKLRGICKMKRIGHTGTLDPDAEGVLPVCLGKATKLCGLLTDKDKEYKAVMRLGVVTDTQDMSGRVLEQRPVQDDQKKILAAIESFVGEYDQIPPMYSAVKVNGKRLYQLAREGVEVERTPRHIRIESIQVGEISLPLVTMTVVCSRGTYIRTLCHDIGQRLGCGAAMESLLRTRSGLFSLEKSMKLDQVKAHMEAGDLERYLLPLDALFLDYPRAFVREEGEKLLYNGNPMPAALLQGEDELLNIPEGGFLRIYDRQGRFIGLYSFQKKRQRFNPGTLFLG